MTNYCIKTTKYNGLAAQFYLIIKENAYLCIIKNDDHRE